MLETLIFRIFRNTLRIVLDGIRACITGSDYLGSKFTFFLNDQLMDVRKYSRLGTHRTVNFELSLIEAMIDFLSFNCTSAFEAQNMAARLSNRWSSWLPAECTYIWHICLFLLKSYWLYFFQNIWRRNCFFFMEYINSQFSTSPCLNLLF